MIAKASLMHKCTHTCSAHRDFAHFFQASLSHPWTAPGTPKRKVHSVGANVFSMLTNMVTWFWASTHFSMTSLKDTVKTFCCETVA